MQHAITAKAKGINTLRVPSASNNEPDRVGSFSAFDFLCLLSLAQNLLSGLILPDVGAFLGTPFFRSLLRDLLRSQLGPLSGSFRSLFLGFESCLGRFCSLNFSCRNPSRLFARSFSFEHGSLRSLHRSFEPRSPRRRDLRAGKL